MVCAWARAFPAERKRSTEELEGLERRVSSGAFASELGAATPGEIKEKARELRLYRLSLQAPHKMRRVAKPAVIAAAKVVLEYVQIYLRERLTAGGELSYPEQHEMWFLQVVAVDAWEEVAKKKSHAKEWQKVVSNNRPLTICYDRPFYDFSDFGLDRVAGPHARWGCGRIILDSLHAGGDGMFKRNCGGDHCHPGRDALKKAKRRVVVRHT
jgi:hypothetical protein